MDKAKKVVRNLLPASWVQKVEDTYRQGRGYVWQAFYGFPAKNLRVIAVTGTNGKTTTAAYINEVLKAGGYKTAVFTTAFNEIGGVYVPRTTTRTLEKQSELQALLSQAKTAGVDIVILEVTSHALEQKRILGITVEVAVITNLSQEHLDYHKTMQAYAYAKARLTREYGAKYAVLNSDDAWFDYFKDSSLAKVFSCGKSPGSDAHVTSVRTTKDGSTASIKHGRKSLSLKTSLIGDFNLSNASLAAGVGLLLGIDPKQISAGVAGLKAVPGRMEPIDEGQPFKVLVDYAVTPDSIERALASLKKITKGKLRIVFGATGDRDREKRPLMGAVAAKNADFIYLTDDETYTEDPKQIIDAVYAGIKNSKGEKKTKIIAERGDAIKQALSDAKKTDTVYITGIGHETSRNMGGEQVSWDDRDVTRELLKDL